MVLISKREIIYECRSGVTLVELLTTLLIVSFLSLTVGVLAVNLLNIQEQDREEAFIREKLVEICGEIADIVSVGSTFSVSNGIIEVVYRQETGGISLETGMVSRVARFCAATNSFAGNYDFSIYQNVTGNLVRAISRNVRGDAPLIPLTGKIVKMELVPFSDDEGLGKLSIGAAYTVKNMRTRQYETKAAESERLVRLWNNK